MSLASKRRDTEVFSLSFLDCICCGFGAVLLVFLLTISTKSMVDKGTVDEVQERVVRAEQQSKMTKAELDRIAAQLAAAQLELRDLDSNNQKDQLKVTDRQRELLLLLQQTGAMKDALATLLEEKKNLPTEEVAPVPIPNIDRRQYLTGVKLTGEFIVFVLRTSGSMLDETIDAAALRVLQDTPEQKREAPKWRRTVHAMQWMIASLDPDTHFQILLFAEDTTSILPGREDDWFSLKDKKTIAEIIKKLDEIVPQGGANLERAFTRIRFLPRLPDSIVLLTDGLPTKSESLPMEGEVQEEHRIRFFEIARKQLPPRIPVSTILFPLLTGDPGAPGLYWELANSTRGALVSPSKSWPDL